MIMIDFAWNQLDLAWLLSQISIPTRGHSDFDMWKSNTFPWRPVTPRGGFLLFSLSPGLRQDVDASAVRLHRRRVLFFGDLRGWESSRFQVAVLRLEFADTDMEVATHYPLVFGFWWIAISQKVWIVTVKAKAYKLQDPSGWISVDLRPLWKIPCFTSKAQCLL